MKINQKRIKKKMKNENFKNIFDQENFKISKTCDMENHEAKNISNENSNFKKTKNKIKNIENYSFYTKENIILKGKSEAKKIYKVKFLLKELIKNYKIDKKFDGNNELLIEILKILFDEDENNNLEINEINQNNQKIKNQISQICQNNSKKSFNEFYDSLKNKGNLNALLNEIDKFSLSSDNEEKNIGINTNNDNKKEENIKYKEEQNYDYQNINTILNNNKKITENFSKENLMSNMINFDLLKSQKTLEFNSTKINQKCLNDKNEKEEKDEKDEITNLVFCTECNENKFPKELKKENELENYKSNKYSSIPSKNYINDNNFNFYYKSGSHLNVNNLLQSESKSRLNFLSKNQKNINNDISNIANFNTDLNRNYSTINKSLQFNSNKTNNLNNNSFEISNILSQINNRQNNNNETDNFKYNFKSCLKKKYNNNDFIEEIPYTRSNNKSINFKEIYNTDIIDKNFCNENPNNDFDTYSPSQQKNLIYRTSNLIKNSNNNIITNSRYKSNNKSVNFEELNETNTNILKAFLSERKVSINNNDESTKNESDEIKKLDFTYFNNNESMKRTKASNRNLIKNFKDENNHKKILMQNNIEECDNDNDNNISIYTKDVLNDKSFIFNKTYYEMEERKKDLKIINLTKKIILLESAKKISDGKFKDISEKMKSMYMKLKKYKENKKENNNIFDNNKSLVLKNHLKNLNLSGSINMSFKEKNKN